MLCQLYLQNCGCIFHSPFAIFHISSRVSIIWRVRGWLSFDILTVSPFHRLAIIQFLVSERLQMLRAVSCNLINVPTLMPPDMKSQPPTCSSWRRNCCLSRQRRKIRTPYNNGTWERRKKMKRVSAVKGANRRAIVRQQIQHQGHTMDLASFCLMRRTVSSLQAFCPQGFPSRRHPYCIYRRVEPLMWVRFQRLLLGCKIPVLNSLSLNQVITKRGSLHPLLWVFLIDIRK